MKLNEKHLGMIQSRVDELGSYKDFAEEVGVFPETVSRWLSGKTTKIDKDETVLNLAEALDIDVIDLFSIAVNRPMHRPTATRETADRIARFAEWLRQQEPEKQDRFFRMLAAAEFYAE